MPSLPRREVIDESVVGIYHIWSRVALREFLLGLDPKTGRSFRHRKKVIRKRNEALVSIFAIECLEHAVLDNHFHQILRNRPDVVAQWSDWEVAERWLRLKRSSLDLQPPPKEERIAALVANREELAEIRRRLSSISWFMAYLREPLARVFNLEGGTTGTSFWAGRFGCSRLEDELAVLVCCLYVCMNLIRAGIARGIGDSEDTSVHNRLEDRRSGDAGRPESGWLAAVHVDGDGYAGVAARRRASDKGYLELSFDEYLQVLDELIQRERAERTGWTEPQLPSVLERLGIDSAAWELAVQVTSRQFGRELEIAAKLAADAGKARPR